MSTHQFVFCTFCGTMQRLSAESATPLPCTKCGRGEFLTVGARVNVGDTVIVKRPARYADPNGQTWTARLSVADKRFLRSMRIAPDGPEPEAAP